MGFERHDFKTEADCSTVDPIVKCYNTEGKSVLSGFFFNPEKTEIIVHKRLSLARLTTCHKSFNRSIKKVLKVNISEAQLRRSESQ